MIISASRRTDIPAFYAQWFINRIKDGYCTVPIPFNSKQISTISLKPEDVEVIAFWTRYPQPLIPYLDELDRRGLHYYFQYTILGYPKQIDPASPDLEKAITTFKSLVEKIGKEKVIWRYDPIVFSSITDAIYHQEKYKYIAEALKGYTLRSVISLADEYYKTRKRMLALEKMDVKIMQPQITDEWFCTCMQNLSDIAMANNMEPQSCAEVLDLSSFGIQAGKCIDDEYIQRLFKINLNLKKDPNQRAMCGCVVSKDIGMYDSCLFECPYCYATKSFDLAHENHKKHDPKSPSLLGW